MSREDLYKDFFIPLSQLREEWKRAQMMMKTDAAYSFGCERMALLHYISFCKLRHVEDKLLKLLGVRLLK
ncbi:MAG: hypothetical protein GY797_20910 [Deltaproteobacteria bacterium]|nr:hypothetical protein [Deltaproteobacteria bacterium]